MTDGSELDSWPKIVGAIVATLLVILTTRFLATPKGEKPATAASSGSPAIDVLASRIAEMEAETDHLKDQVRDTKIEMERATENLRLANERAEREASRARRAEAALAAAGLPIPPPHD